MSVIGCDCPFTDMAFTLPSMAIISVMIQKLL